MKVLLLNPPGQGRLVIRDYYCSKESKANYYNSPIDLVIQSGYLQDMEVSLVDATIDNLSERQTLDKIKQINPDVILSLVGAANYNADMEFLSQIKEVLPKIALIVSGDNPKEEPKETLEKYSHIDGILLNFASRGLYNYIRKEGEIMDMVIREAEGIKFSVTPDKTFSIAIPRHDLFLQHNYRMPFARRYPLATTLWTYACPFKCTFCIMNTFAYKEREIEEIVAELDYLKSIGVKEIFLLDQTIGINKKKFIEIMKIMIEKQYGFGWFGFSRVDVLDEEMIKLMKKAGCHTIWFGIESANDTTLKTYKKGYTQAQIRQTIALTKKYGIKVLATFLLGLPEENYADMMRTIDFAIEVDVDYASFNFAVPRLGTELRAEALRDHLVGENIREMNQSGQEVSMGTKYVTKDEIQKLRRIALTKFYLRPTYLIKRLLAIRTFTEFKEHFLNAWYLLK